MLPAVKAEESTIKVYCTGIIVLNGKIQSSLKQYLNSEQHTRQHEVSHHTGSYNTSLLNTSRI